METLLVDRMVLFMADDGGDFTPLRVAGFAMAPPELLAVPGSAVASRQDTSSRSTIRWPRAVFSDDEIEFWRDWGPVLLSCRASPTTGTIAILALGRRDSAEPLSSEGHGVAAAQWPDRLPPRSRTALVQPASRQGRRTRPLREFSDNVLQSLDDGLVVSDPRDASSGGTALSKSSTEYRRHRARPPPGAMSSTHVSSRR
jgi:hypothetical protein